MENMCKKSEALELLRRSFSGGDPECLADIIDDSAVYESELGNRRYVGADAVLELFRHIHDNPRCETYIADDAVIVDAPHDAEYPTGTQCILLSRYRGLYESIVFVDFNNEGMITRLWLCGDLKYRFTLCSDPMGRALRITQIMCIVREGEPKRKQRYGGKVL